LSDKELETQSREIVVIGGSAGIGLEITRRLLARGHRVTVVSRQRNDLPELPGLGHIALDITREQIPEGSLPDRLDGLVYTPGTINLKPFQRLEEQDFETDLRVNFLGAVRAIQGCLTRLKRARQGGSVLLFSTVAVQQGMPFHASVASAKGAVEGLTRSLAAELAPGVRVNAIAPSLTDTRLAAQLLSSDAKREASAKRHPLGRVGATSDIAAMAVFLLEGSGDWITGQVMHVDGGLSALKLAS
jgi:NAD(P)-dependent dehydrogenase (short-subunit alcohol dehydrogenase family)